MLSSSWHGMQATFLPGEHWQYNLVQVSGSNIGVAKCRAGLWRENKGEWGQRGEGKNWFTQYSQLRERVVLASLRATWKPCKSIILSGTFSHRTEEKENTIDIGMYQSIMHGTTPVREQIDRVSQISNDSVPSLFNQFHSYSSRMIFSSPPASLIVFQIQDGTHPTLYQNSLSC